MKHSSFAAHNFFNLEDAPFCPKQYSRLKFGCDQSARKMGYELARSFYSRHTDVLLANRVVVIPSPYNHVPNAATVMTMHMIDKLNHLLVNASGRHVEYSIIHRKVSYISDYGFLNKAKRKGLIDNDQFYLNRDFLKDKLLLFVDDVRITGTHEDKLKEILVRDSVPNEAYFLYYANYQGNQADIEAKLNFASVKNLDDYLQMTNDPDHHVIIRPIKYLLGQPTEVLRSALTTMPLSFVTKVYNGCLAEGYYKIPAYQQNFAVIANAVVAE